MRAAASLAPPRPVSPRPPPTDQEDPVIARVLSSLASERFEDAVATLSSPSSAPHLRASPVASAAVFDAVLAAAAARRDGSAALALLELMRALRVPRGHEAQAHALKALCRSNRVGEAAGLLRQLPPRALSRAHVGAVLRASAARGDWAAGGRVAQRLREIKAPLDVAAWAADMLAASVRLAGESELVDAEDGDAGVGCWVRGEEATPLPRVVGGTARATAMRRLRAAASRARDAVEAEAVDAQARVAALAALSGGCVVAWARVGLWGEALEELGRLFDLCAPFLPEEVRVAPPGKCEEPFFLGQPRPRARRAVDAPLPRPLDSARSACLGFLVAAEAQGRLGRDGNQTSQAEAARATLSPLPPSASPPVTSPHAAARQAARRCVLLMTGRGLAPSAELYDARMRAAPSAAALSEAVDEMEALGFRASPRSLQRLLRAQGREGVGALDTLRRLLGGGGGEAGHGHPDAFSRDASSFAAAQLSLPLLSQASLPTLRKAFLAVGGSQDLVQLNALYEQAMAAGVMASAPAFAAAFEGLRAWGRAQARARRQREDRAEQAGDEAQPGLGQDGTFSQGPASQLLAGELADRWEADLRRARVRLSGRGLCAQIGAWSYAGRGHKVAHAAKRALLADAGRVAGNETLAPAIGQSALPGSPPPPSDSQLVLNAALGALCRYALVAEATELVRLAQGLGLTLDAHGSTSLISACAASGDLEVARRLFEAARAGETQAHAPHALFNALLKAEIAGEGARQGLRLAMERTLAGPGVDVVGWTTLWRAARREGDEEIVRAAGQELRKLKEASLGRGEEHWSGYYLSDEDEW